ncbi:MAG TPA: hypothetical protein VFN65_01770, partial [Solirubrobacteraceae bacterium]|nr:hypothetical protein [Solirubrobacteraceae bacterium]
NQPAAAAHAQAADLDCPRGRHVNNSAGAEVGVCRILQSPGNVSICAWLSPCRAAAGVPAEMLPAILTGAEDVVRQRLAERSRRC